MDLYQLRYFLETARELNFTRAAEALGVSPSAVSRSISQLESSVGKPLFARSKRHVALTAAGETLKIRAERVFDEIEGARVELAGEVRAPETLRIGSREMITNYLLPEPLRLFRERFENTRFGLYELEHAAMTEAIKNDRLDFGFHYTDIPDPALGSIHLGKLKSHVYASKAYLNKNGRPRNTAELLKHPFIAPRGFGEDPTAPRADGFPDHKHPRRVQYETDLLETHRRFVLDGLCIGVLPDFVMGKNAVALEGPPIFRDIYFFMRRGRVLPKAAEFLIASVKTAVKNAANA